MHSTITSEALNAALEAVAVASADAGQCMDALFAASGLLQDAVLNGASETFFDDALDNVPDELLPALRHAMDNAVNYHAAGDVILNLMLFPVVLASDTILPSRLPLPVEKLALLRAEALVRKQLGLIGEGAKGAWCFASPALLHEQHVLSADVADLIKYPHNVREFVREGQAGHRPEFPAVELDSSQAAAGMHLYFLPVVVCRPATSPLAQVQPDADLHAHLTKWLSDALAAAKAPATQIILGAGPAPFSMGAHDGATLEVAELARARVLSYLGDQQMLPKGMAAFIAPYSIGGTDLVVGISLMSRLTQRTQHLMSLRLNPSYTQDGAKEVAAVAAALTSLGLANVSATNHIHHTDTCHSCGAPQMATPTFNEIFPNGTEEQVH